MRRRAFLGLVGAASAATGCQYLPAAQAGVDAAQAVAGSMLSIVDTIDSFAENYFVQHPDPAKQVIVLKGIGRTRQVIAVLFDVLSTAKDAMSLDVQKAIQDAQKAYADLLALTQPLGVVTKGSAAAAVLRGTGADVLEVPAPEAFKVLR